MPADNFNNVSRSKKSMILNNFIGGIAWGLGATIGLAIFLAVSGFIMGQINLIPFVGTFVSDTYNYVIDKNPRLDPQNSLSPYR